MKRLLIVLLVIGVATAALSPAPAFADRNWLEKLIDDFCDYCPECCSGGDWWE